MSALCVHVGDNWLLRDYAEGSNHPQDRRENGMSMNLLGKFVLGFFYAEMDADRDHALKPTPYNVG